MHSQPAHSLMHICNTIRCLAHTGTMCICTNTPHVQVSADTHTLHVPTCLFTWAVYAGIALQICLCTHTHTHTHHVKHTCTVYAYPHEGVTSHIPTHAMQVRTNVPHAHTCLHTSIRQIHITTDIHIYAHKDQCIYVHSALCTHTNETCTHVNHIHRAHMHTH